MDADLALITGLIAGAVAVPAILTSISDGRAPRFSLLTVLVAFGLVGYALVSKPGGYSVEQIPGVFFSVAARFF